VEALQQAWKPVRASSRHRRSPCRAIATATSPTQRAKPSATAREPPPSRPPWPAKQELHRWVRRGCFERPARRPAGVHLWRATVAQRQAAAGLPKQGPGAGMLARPSELPTGAHESGSAAGWRRLGASVGAKTPGAHAVPATSQEGLSWLGRWRCSPPRRGCPRWARRGERRRELA